jgi:hypothetical protein
MSVPGQSRRSGRALITSGLPLMNGHFQIPSTCLKGAISGHPRVSVNRQRDGFNPSAPLSAMPSRKMSASGGIAPGHYARENGVPDLGQ